MKCPSCKAKDSLGMFVTIRRWLPAGKFHTVQTAGAQVSKGELQTLVDEQRFMVRLEEGGVQIPARRIVCKECKEKFVYLGDGYGIRPDFEGEIVPKVSTTEAPKVPTLPQDFSGETPKAPPTPPAASPAPTPVPAQKAVEAPKRRKFVIPSLRK